MRVFTLSVAEGKRQVAQNATYPSNSKIKTAADLTCAAKCDHCGGLFKNGHRGNDDFISADVLMMDCDNGQTNEKALWLTPGVLEGRLPRVAFYIVYSKSHMRNKGNFSPRPRFHVYFPLSEIVKEADRIRELKEKLLALIPEFDGGAKDAARFFYGVEKPQVEVHEGDACVDEFLAKYIKDLDEKATLSLCDSSMSGYDTVSKAVSSSKCCANSKAVNVSSETIPEGERNSTLFKEACRTLRMYDEDMARDIFDLFVTRCNPPLPAEEVAQIWRNAKSQTAKEAVKNKAVSVDNEGQKILTPAIVEHSARELGLSWGYNVFAHKIEVLAPLPAGLDGVPSSYYRLKGKALENATIKLLPQLLFTHFKKQKFFVNYDFLKETVDNLASTHPFNPVERMLTAGAWDGKDRISPLLGAIGLDAPNKGGIIGELVRKWLHQAVAMALNDNAEFNAEFILVLQGPQGIGKTNFFRRLAIRPEWFGEGLNIDMNDKDSLIRATSVWIGEIGELDQTLKREQATFKSFVTAKSDAYRPVYGRFAETHERRACFCGTINPEEAIRDDTGSRRFVIIHVDTMDKDFIYQTMTPEWCTQLWRQVYEQLYQALGAGNFYLTDEELAFVEKTNEQYTRPLKGEIELRDLYDWDSPVEAWRWYTVSDVIGSSDLLAKRGIGAVQIGRALTRIYLVLGLPVKRYKRRTGKIGMQYLMPPHRSLRGEGDAPDTPRENDN